MKHAISIWSFPFEWELERKLALAQEAGFQGFELEIAETGPIRLDSTQEELRAVRTLLARYRLEPSGLATALYWGANGASRQEATRHQAREILHAQIRTAAALGIDAALVIPASVGVDFIPGCEVVPYEEAWARGRELLLDAAPLAQAHGVRLLVENVWNKFLLSPREFASFVDSIGSPHVGAYFDVGNALATGYPEDWITTLGGRIGRVHFKDYRRNVGTADGFVELLSGDVEWPAVTAALRKIGYEGWITAEMIPPLPFYKHHPELLIHNTARAMQAILAPVTTPNSPIRQ